ncbi:MAG: ChrR family anti-sigma-E factor [Proteobacteria bacterium]|nr:ChrR family anti-sigma-E factor [Pseudomonadota bacterium]
MTPIHHIPEEELIAYAGGATTEGLALFVATHLALCPDCRAVVEDWEAAAGLELEDQEETELPSGLLDRVLAELDDTPLPADEAPPDRAVLPQPLRGYVGDVHELQWRRLVPGIRQVVLPFQIDGTPLRLFELQAGLKIPVHTHTGTERTLVLTGGFTDQAGQYGPGDVSFLDDSENHVQVIDPGEPCIALIAADGPLVPRSVTAWLLSWFVTA